MGIPLIGLEVAESRICRWYCVVVIDIDGLERERSVFGGLMCRDRSGDGGGGGIEGVSMERPWNSILFFSAIFACFLTIVIRYARVREVLIQSKSSLSVCALAGVR